MTKTTEDAMPNAGAVADWKQQEAGLPDKWPPDLEPSLQEDDDLKAEIQRARKLLDLPAGWDGEGSATFSRETFDRAVTFLNNHWEHLKRFRIQPPVPTIAPGPEGSIDLHWKRQSWELLVNIPANVDELAAFYGDNYGAQKIRGSVDPKTFNFGIAAWLLT